MAEHHSKEILDFQRIMDNIPPGKKKKWQFEFEAYNKWEEWLREKGYKWNTPTSYSLELIIHAGFNPIGISQIQLEETFIFETNIEARKAFKYMEQTGEVSGFWYGKKPFLKARKEYESDMKAIYGSNYKGPEIYWL